MFSHGMWLSLADDDVSELPGTDREFRNIVVSQNEPHTVGKHKNKDISRGQSVL